MPTSLFCKSSTPLALLLQVFRHVAVLPVFVRLLRAASPDVAAWGARLLQMLLSGSTRNCVNAESAALNSLLLDWLAVEPCLHVQEALLDVLQVGVWEGGGMVGRKHRVDGRSVWYVGGWIG